MMPDTPRICLVIACLIALSVAWAVWAAYEGGRRSCDCTEEVSSGR